MYNQPYFGPFLGASWWTFLGAALFREGYFIGGVWGIAWDVSAFTVIGLLFIREMGPWLLAHYDVEAAKNYAGAFLDPHRRPFFSFVRFDYPRSWHERVVHTKLIDYPIEPLIAAFRFAKPWTLAYQQLKIALTVNHRLIAFQKIRDLYNEFHDRDADLDEIFQSMQYTSVLSADKTGGYWGRLQNRRTYRGRGDETHHIIIEALRRLHKQYPGETLDFADFAASDATITMELAKAARAEGIDYVRFHASDKAHEFYIVNGLDPRSKDTLVFDAEGHLLQSSSPKGRLWVRWTLVDSYPPGLVRFELKAIMWLNGTLRSTGRNGWVKKMEDLYRQAQQPKLKSMIGYTNGNGLKIQKVDLINPRAREFAERYPHLFQIDEPTNVLEPIHQQFHAARLWSLGMRGEAAYHSDEVINAMLTNVGLSIVEGGIVVSGTKGTLREPEKLIREVYIVRPDQLELQSEHSAGYPAYPASIPLNRSTPTQREAA